MPARTKGSTKRTPRLALVTGASRGLGLETARQLHAKGAYVLLGVRDEARGRAIAQELGADRADALHVDVSSADSVSTAVERIRADYGRLDVLINNAAIHYDTWQTASTANIDQVVEALNTNLIGAWRLAVALRELLVESRPGIIVNVTSGAGALGSIGARNPAYAVSKAALNALTISLAHDLKRHGVLVNAVCPGWVHTDMGGAGGRPVADGAAGIVWAATLSTGGPTGGFFRDGKTLSWYDG